MKYEHGTFTRLANKLGYSPAYVAMVANGSRRNARIELALATEKIHQAKHRKQLANLLKKLSRQEKCATSNPTSSN